MNRRIHSVRERQKRLHNILSRKNETRMEDFKKMEELLRTKIKDKATFENAMKMIENRNSLVSFYRKDVERIIRKGKSFSFIAGQQSILKKIKDPDKICGAMLLVESGNQDLEYISDLGEALTESMGYDSEIIWASETKKGMKRTRLSLLLAYTD